MKKKNIIDKFFGLFDRYPRDFFVAAFFIFAVLVIIWNVFSYTVLNYDFYSNLASKQQVSETKVDVKRWSIYSSDKKNSVLATSVVLNDLAIDPQVEWNKAKLASFLTDIVYKQICEYKDKKECKNGILRFLSILDIEDFKQEEIYLKEKIRTKVKEKVNRDNVTSVLLRDDLSEDESYELIRLNLSWVYINDTRLYVNPEEILDKNFIANKIISVIWWDQEKISHLIRKRKIRYVPIINKLSIWISDQIELMLEEEISSLKRWLISDKDRIWNFIILTPNLLRYYPENTLASQVLWFVDNDLEGHYWIEWYFNNLLRGKKWTLVSKKDTMWRVIDPTFSLVSDVDDAVWWVKITTTIDRNIQRSVENILENWVKEFKANKWSIIVMNPKNGEIISMANFPSFNSNIPWEVYEIEKLKLRDYIDAKTELLWVPILVEDNIKWWNFYYNWKIKKLRIASREELWEFISEKPMYKFKNNFWAWVYKNWIIQDLYEPGSIMKAVTVAVWLDIWEIERYEMYEDKWFVTIDNFKIKNVDEKCLGLHTFQHAFNYSCNVWMIRIAQRIWKSLFSKYLDDFWFWKLSWITLEWEVFWKINPYEKWSRAQLFTTSFGQWITSTMLQMATAYSTLANGWLYVQPQIIRSLEFDNWKVINNRVEPKYRVIKKETSDLMTEILTDSIKNWVAKHGWVEWFNLAWKTWTSQIAYKWKYEKWHATTIWSYAWYGPSEDPKFVIIVKLDRPRTSQYGWATSAKMFSRVSEFLLNYYGVPKKKVEEK